MLIHVGRTQKWRVSFPGFGSWTIQGRKGASYVLEACMHSFLFVLDWDCDMTSCFKFPLPWLLAVLNYHPELWAKMNLFSLKLFSVGGGAYFIPATKMKPASIWYWLQTKAARPGGKLGVGSWCKDLFVLRLWGIQECFLDVYKSCRTLPSVKPMLTVDELAHAGIIDSIGGLEANPKKAGAQREKGVTSVV